MILTRVIFLLFGAIGAAEGFLQIQKNNLKSNLSASLSSDGGLPYYISTKSKAVVDWDWKQVVKDVFEESDKPILLFDGVCNFCNGGVNMCLDFDDDATFRYASLQSKVGQSLLVNFGKEPNDISSLVLVTSSKDAYFQSDAVLRVGEKLKGLPMPLRFGAIVGRTLTPSFVRDGLYKIVAKNRYLFGESDGPQCRLDLDGDLQSRFVEDPDI